MALPLGLELVAPHVDPCPLRCFQGLQHKLEHVPP